MRLWHRATLSKQGTSGGVPRFDMAPAVLASRAKGGQVRTKVANASGRHMPTYDSCLVTLTGLVLRVLPRLALRVRTRATYACLASTCWLSITLGALIRHVSHNGQRNGSGGGFSSEKPAHVGCTLAPQPPAQYSSGSTVPSPRTVSSKHMEQGFVAT